MASNWMFSDVANELSVTKCHQQVATEMKGLEESQKNIEVDAATSYT